MKFIPSELQVTPSPEFAEAIEHDLATAASGMEVRSAIKDLYDRQTKRDENRQCGNR